jgi:GT2 family glycosyltransferase
MLARSIKAISAQDHPVEAIIVVDNAGDRAAPIALAEQSPRVIYLAMPENLGPAGGFAEGMRHGHREGFTHLWLFNDDAVPRREALSQCIAAALELAPSSPSVAAHYAVRTGLTEPSLVDVFSFNGALVDRRVVDRVGYPRAEFFMQHEEWDYSQRIRAAGLPIINIPGNAIENAAAGTVDGATPPWRGYYQTRNELVSAISDRSPRLICRWMLRTIKFSVATLLWGDQKWKRLRLRVLGTWHALRGRLGRTIEPDITGGA